MSTHNICFGAKIRKIGITLHTPIFLYKWGLRGYILRGNISLMYIARRQAILPIIVQKDINCVTVRKNWA